MYEKLKEVQLALKVPKNQRNEFGKYNYRSCEDIVEAAKPLCIEHGLVLTLSDEIVEVAGRVYVKSTAKLTEGKTSVETQGWAREAETKKGMDESQITGAASSYARKYALNGLFAIDDTKDTDHTNDGTQAKSAPAKASKPDTSATDAVIKILSTAKSVDELRTIWSTLSAAAQKDPEVRAYSKELSEKLPEPVIE